MAALVTFAAAPMPAAVLARVSAGDRLGARP